MVQDRVTFERAISIAQDQHQEAIRQARSTFDAACQQAQVDWTARVATATARFDEVKGREPDEGFDVIKRELDEATGTNPDIEGARAQLGREVKVADAALNEALAEARAKLLTPPNGR